MASIQVDEFPPYSPHWQKHLRVNVFNGFGREPGVKKQVRTTRIEFEYYRMEP